MPFDIKSFSKYTGLITVLILWISVLVAIYKAELDIFGKKPLSSLGVTTESAPYFSIGLVLAAFTFIVFGHYLKQYFTISKSFLISMYVGQIGQIIAAVTPYGDKQPAKLIHTLAAFTLAFAIPIMIWRFTVMQQSGRLRKIYYLLMWLEIAAFIIGIGAFAFVLKGAPIGQMLPAIAFHFWIICISVILIKNLDTELETK